MWGAQHTLPSSPLPPSSLLPPLSSPPCQNEGLQCVKVHLPHHRTLLERVKHGPKQNLVELEVQTHLNHARKVGLGTREGEGHERHTHVGWDYAHLKLGHPVGIVHVPLSTVGHPLTVGLVDQLAHLGQGAALVTPTQHPLQQMELTAFFTSLLKLFSVPLYPAHRQTQHAAFSLPPQLFLRPLPLPHPPIIPQYLPW